MKTCICDTSSLIRLQRGGVIGMLGNIFEVVFVPNAVQKELKAGNFGKIIEENKIETKEVKKILPIGLGAGEREAISLAKEMNIAIIITDDEKARKKAIKMKLVPLRSYY